MTLVQKTFDTQTSGTAATTANTGASSINALSGGTVTFASSVAARGTACGIKTTFTGTSSAADIRFALTPAQKYALEWEWTAPAALPTVDFAFFDLRTSVHALYIQYRTTGAFRIQDANTTGLDLSGTFSPNTRYRFALLVDNTGGAGASHISLNVYTETGTTPIGSYSSNTANISTGNYVEARFGLTSSPAGAISYGFDDIQWDDGRTTEIGPITSATPPTIVTNDRALYVIDVHGSSSTDGGTLTHTITQTAGTATTPTLLAPGIWGVVQSTSEALTYQTSTTDSIYGTAVVAAHTVPKLVTNTGAPRISDGAGGWI